MPKQSTKQKQPSSDKSRRSTRNGRKGSDNVVPMAAYAPSEAANEDRSGPPKLKPMNKAQGQYLTTIQSNLLTLGTGPAGTGKTYVCTAYAAEQLIDRKISKIIVTRPAIEASGKGMGFLPGSIEEKFAPYFEPFRRILVSYFGESNLEYMIKKGRVEIAPLEYLRGLTFENAFVILDEAQNTTPAQMKLFLTRIGEYSTVVVNGDTDQKDIKGLSGLEDAIQRLGDCPDVAQFEFTELDIVRSGLVREILKRYRVAAKA
jgi:phosphate starvation-inducible PhoH-like protein